MEKSGIDQRGEPGYRGSRRRCFCSRSAGYRVIILDIDAEEGESARRSLSARFGQERVLFLAADVSLEEDVRSAAALTAEQFGMPFPAGK